MKRIYYLLALVLLISGCSKYGYVSLNYPQLPQAYLSDDVNFILIY